MKEVKKVGIRPVLEFVCKTCGCVWTDDNYEAREPFNRVIMMSFQCKVLTSDCPTCKMPSSNYSELNKGENND